MVFLKLNVSPHRGQKKVELCQFISQKRINWEIKEDLKDGQVKSYILVIRNIEKKN